MKKVIEQLIQFQKDRNWEKFHTPANLAKSISIEAGELLENFQWDDSFDKKKVEEELADVLIYSLYLANSLDLDVEEIISSKIKLNAMKYPINKSKGNSKKYTEF